MRLWYLDSEIVFEKTWNGVDLVALARQRKGLLRNGFPTLSFYEAFYRELARDDASIGEDWLETKRSLSELLWTKLAHGTGRESFSLLSIGCGTGIVEMPWARRGCRLTLHEVSNTACLRLDHETRKAGVEGSVEIVSGLPSTLAPRRFDAVLLGSVEYTVVSEKALIAEFYHAAAQLLCEGGVLLAWDPLPHRRTSSSYVKALRKALIARTGGIAASSVGIPWGVARSPWYRSRVMSRVDDLLVEQVEVYDSAHRLVETGPAPSTGIGVVLARRKG